MSNTKFKNGRIVSPSTSSYIRKLAKSLTRYSLALGVPSMFSPLIPTSSHTLVKKTLRGYKRWIYDRIR